MKTEINTIVSTSGKITPLCRWAEDENGTWHTSCGNMFEIIDGTPDNNDMKFCCYCGKHLTVQEWRDDDQHS